MKYFMTLALLVGFAIGAALAVQDITPPTLDSFSVSPVSIDTSNGDRTVTATMTISDALSGFDSGAFAIISPGPCEAQWVPFTGAARTAGDAYSGTYQVTVTWPQYSCTGAWKVWAVTLKDRVRNNGANPKGSAVFGQYTAVTLN